METTIKQVFIGAGLSLKDAVELLKEEAQRYSEPVCAEFNGHYITSVQTYEEAFKTVTGMSENNAAVFTHVWPFIHEVILRNTLNLTTKEISEILHTEHENFKNYLNKYGEAQNIY